MIRTTSRRARHGAVILLTASLLNCTSGMPPATRPHALDAAPSPLYDEILRLDDRLSAAFNGHDIDMLMALFSADVEFYHDIGGLQSFAAVKAGFAGLFSQNNGIRRERVPGTLRVFPIEGYGALELGRHRFCHDENGRTECGTFEFVQVWRREGATWKIARVISYGH